MEGLSKDKYIGVVEYTFNSMLERSKADKNYDILLDLVHYYDRTIRVENVLTREEFLELATKAGISWWCIRSFKMTREEEFNIALEKAKTKIIRLPSGTYAYKNIRIEKLLLDGEYML